MEPKDVYLVAYNTACCLGWTVVLVLAIASLFDSVVGQSIPLLEACKSVYGDVAIWLQISQTAALMEIVHAAVGFVRSPVVITAAQVSSRILALVGIVSAPTAQGNF